MCNGISIKQQTSVKYLGSIIDQTLSGFEIATNTIKKLMLAFNFYIENRDIKAIRSKNNYVCLCFIHDLTMSAIFGIGVFLGMLPKNYSAVKIKL